MPARIEHKIENGIEVKRCGKCKRYKQLNKFHKANNTWDGLFYKCIKCKNSELNNNTRKRAVSKYAALCWRVANDERYVKKGIKVKISQQEFIDWYLEHYISKGCHIDRIDNHGHYELGNLQILTQLEHNLKRRQDRLDWLGIIEPDGMRYCFTCEALRPETEFYVKQRKISNSNPKGLDECCKECSRTKRMDYYYRTKTL